MAPHHGKENRLSKRKARNPHEVIDPWPFRVPTAKKGSTNTRIILGPIASTPVPNFGTFSTYTAQKPQKPQRVGAWTPLREIWMPYNNAAIPPSEEITGSASLPLARVKRILALDEDIHQCSNNGAFVITVATELFIRYLAEQAMNVVKTEKKPRRNIQYKDLANAVTRIDNLEFLSDVIPKTTTFREFKEKKSRTVKPNAPLLSGQTTLDQSRSLPTRPADVINPTEAQATEESFQAEASGDGYGREATLAKASRSNGEVVFEHYEPEGNPQNHYDSDDVEMG
ncbi:MAG: hypothetical protein LQ350_000262 [Teloschistes chrysophthalmus]|nr:MAG: hypothetical protein LQ350_000262 [Niorma chrysophthalma]